MVFGVFSTLFWFILIAHLKSWQPSRLTLGTIVMAIAVINIAGLVYLIRKYRKHPRWLVITGVCGNALSLLLIVYAILGSLFLEYVFRM